MLRNGRAYIKESVLPLHAEETMKPTLLFVTLSFQIILADYAHSNVSTRTPIKSLSRSKNGVWVSVTGRLIASRGLRLTIRDKSGTVNAYYNAGVVVPRLQRHDTITVTGIINRRATSVSLQIQHLEKDGKPLYENITHFRVEIPDGYEQSSLNRTISSVYRRNRSKAITYTSIGVAAQLAPLVLMAPTYRNAEGGGKVGVVLVTAVLEWAVTPISVPFIIAGIKCRNKTRRMPSLIPQDIPEFEEIELDLSLQVKPVHNGGGLFLVGNF